MELFFVGLFEQKLRASCTEEKVDFFIFDTSIPTVEN